MRGTGCQQSIQLVRDLEASVYETYAHDVQSCTSFVLNPAIKQYYIHGLMCTTAAQRVCQRQISPVHQWEMEGDASASLPAQMTASCAGRLDKSHPGHHHVMMEIYFNIDSVRCIVMRLMRNTTGLGRLCQ